MKLTYLFDGHITATSLKVTGEKDVGKLTFTEVAHLFITTVLLRFVDKYVHV